MHAHDGECFLQEVVSDLGMPYAAKEVSRCFREMRAYLVRRMFPFKKETEY